MISSHFFVVGKHDEHMLIFCHTFCLGYYPSTIFKVLHLNTSNGVVPTSYRLNVNLNLRHETTRPSSNFKLHCWLKPEVVSNKVFQLWHFK